MSDTAGAVPHSPAGDPSGTKGKSGVARRGIWGLASQGANTLGNLLAAVFVASNCAAVEFGAWSIGYACVLAVLPMARSVGSTPMLLQSHRLTSETERGAVASALWFGMAVGLILALVGSVLPGPLRPALIAFGIVLPMFLFQDALRYVFIARRRTSMTALMDLTWLFVQLAVFAALLAFGEVTAATATLAWGFGALVSCVWGRLGDAIGLRPGRARTYVKSHRWEMSRLGPDAILGGVSTNSVPVLLGMVGGLQATAALRAGQTLFGPLNVLVSGLAPVITVEAVRGLRRGQSQWRLVIVWSAVIAIVGALLSLMIWSIPDSLGAALLGESWGLVPLVLVPLTLQALIRGPFVCGPLVLRAKHLLNEALAYRAVNTAISLICPVTGMLMSGATGAAWGLMVSGALNGLVALGFLWWTRSRWKEEEDGTT